MRGALHEKAVAALFVSCASHEPATPHVFAACPIRDLGGVTVLVPGVSIGWYPNRLVSLLGLLKGHSLGFAKGWSTSEVTPELAGSMASTKASAEGLEIPEPVTASPHILQGGAVGPNLPSLWVLHGKRRSNIPGHLTCLLTNL
ncbi:hypothetical protein AVEN_94163-1 [Araneus ventricosus]|uniref:Uncharacterized protein n=1 Tax=Araneus ventricosus TaxID=182803 RepID=A0A4Y2VSQ4_ARAVE|nr:hypothetical protein AVEN_94163-1 [Araneus ventricosus]